MSISPTQTALTSKKEAFSQNTSTQILESLYLLSEESLKKKMRFSDQIYLLTASYLHPITTKNSPYNTLKKIQKAVQEILPGLEKMSWYEKCLKVRPDKPVAEFLKNVFQAKSFRLNTVPNEENLQLSTKDTSYLEKNYLEMIKFLHSSNKKPFILINKKHLQILPKELTKFIHRKDTSFGLFTKNEYKKISNYLDRLSESKRTK